MIKKLLLIILIIVTLYIVSIFVSPTLADKIESSFGFTWFNQKIRDLKSWVDSTYTNIPSKDEFLETYDQAKIQAEIKAKDALNWVSEVKWNIDEVRSTLSWAASTYKEVKTSIETTKAQVETWVNAIKTTADTLNQVSNTLNWALSGTLNK